MAIQKENNRRISDVAEGSIADDLGIVPGDILISIDGEEVRDIFDYRTRIMTEALTVTFRLRDGSLFEAEIEKDEDDGLGLSFEEPLLDQCSSCRNKCIFCFIDQMPKGLRPSLYFKDDDLRMSFLTGNYVTLTNLSDEEFERFLRYRLSPMNVSVHATDSEVRKKMMHNRFAGGIMERLNRITEAGISLNCQIVLCPGINDGEVLEKTLEDLSGLGENLLSVAVVPVGITRFREENKLPELKLFDHMTASAVLDLVNRWQKHFLETRGERIFFAADEFFLKAGRPIPGPFWYEGFPQLENGVGMISEHRRQMNKGLAARRRRNVSISTKTADKKLRVMVISGIDAGPYMNSFADQLSVLYNIILEVRPVLNHFFGDTITVTGLLTGQDILRAFEEDKTAGKTPPDVVLLPDCTLKADEDIFLDGMTLEELKERLALKVLVSPASGEGYLGTLDEYTGIFNKSGQRRSPIRGKKINE